MFRLWSRKFTTANGAASKLVLVERHDAYAIVRLNRGPVNSLNLEVLQALDQELAALEKDKTVKGMILASTNPKIFTAGLDIQEMHNPKEERLRVFWRTLQLFYLRLYMSPLATVAAIEGHSPAGGCSLAMGCDSRIMATGGPLIGMNETKLGLVAPFWIKDVMQTLIGHRETERMLGLGLQVDAVKAKAIGLVDEAVEKDQVLPAAKSTMEAWLAIPNHARKATKQLVRQELANQMKANLKADEDYVVDFVTSKPIQQALTLYLTKLRQG